jgi:C4-dicarboxylate transporter, DctM subunit
MIMGQIEFGLIGIGILLILLALGVHVGLTMVIAGFIGFALIGGLNPGLVTITIMPWNKMTDYEFSVMPLFVLMSSFISVSGMGAEAYIAARAWFGKFKGGLAIATTVACGLFAACNGSATAGTLVFGKVAYPEMKKAGYADTLSCGIISAGGTLGSLIPPSMAFVLIGILAELSIGKLFIAGILPGITVIIFYVATIIIWTKLNPSVAPSSVDVPLREKFSSMILAWPMLALFILVMGGIYGGIFTPTEAAGCGAFGSLVITFAQRKMNGRKFWLALMDSAKLTAVIFVMLTGAFIFNAFMAITQMPTAISMSMASLPVPPIVVVIIIVLFYIVTGCFFDIFAVLILTVPILYPAIKALGIDLIWYSVIMVRMTEIGNITPPFGLNLFAMKTVVNVPMSTLYRGAIPFVISDILNVALLLAFPIISTWLPTTAY